MAEELRVEKKQERVGLFMADGVVFEGIVFLSQYAMYHSGEQRVVDLLLEEDAFLPTKVIDGEFQLVRKDMIGHIRCAVHLEEGLDYTERQVRICFVGGETLLGKVKMNMPPHAARLTDYINSGNDFFPLFSGEHSYLVNRNLIRNLIVID